MLRLLEVSVAPDHPLTAFETAAPIVGPVWRNGTVLRPCLFVQGTDDIGLEATVEVTSLASDAGRISLIAESDDPTMMFQGDVPVTPGVRSHVALRRQSGRLSPGIKSVQWELRWSYIVDGQRFPFLTTDPIEIYQVERLPEFAYDIALQYGCRHIDGRPDPVLTLCEEMARTLYYDPVSKNGEAFDVYENGQGDCYAHAEAMEAICVSLGFDAKRVWIWGGDDDREFTYRYATRTEDQRVSIQLSAQAHDAVPANPHFNHHVQVMVDGEVYDPCYGTKGYAEVLEVGREASRQRGDRQPGSVDVDWRCGHSEPTFVPSARVVGGTMRADAPTGHLMTGVDVPALVARVRPDDRIIGSRFGRHGRTLRVETARKTVHCVTLGVFESVAAATTAFLAVRNRSQAPHGQDTVGVGDALAAWAASPLNPTGGSLLFRRANVVVLLTGALEPVASDPSPRERLARDIDAVLGAAFAHRGLVSAGVPDPPRIRFDRDEPVAVPVSSGPTHIAFSIVAPARPEEYPHVFTPDALDARVVMEPSPTLTFYPRRVGRVDCAIVAVTPRAVVGHRRLQVDVVGSQPVAAAAPRRR